MSKSYNKNSNFILFQKISILLAIIIGVSNYLLIFNNIEVIHVPPILLLSYFIADIISGIIHWIGDTLGNENTPFVGNNFIKPFRLHHQNPRLMSSISVSENLGSSFFLIIIPEALLLFIINSSNEELNHIYFLCQNIFFFSALTNLFHRWAHRRRNELTPIIIFLQDYHIILNPTHHQKHHSGDYNKSFCVTNGWGNLILDKLKLWSLLCKLVRKHH